VNSFSGLLSKCNRKYENASLALNMQLHKYYFIFPLQVKMMIYRADPPEVETLDIELTKKPGKNLGLGFFTSNPRGLLVTDIVSHFLIENYYL
jgi:hypothetical protein